MQWLTIPVQVKGKFFQAIKDTQISDPRWSMDHWKTLAHNYARAACFDEYKEVFHDLYFNTTETNLSQVNYKFLRTICTILGIKTKISWSMDYTIIEDRTKRLVNLCQQARATEYISGPSAKGYLQPELFSKTGIKLSFIDYSGYPEYNQLFPPFEHQVTILDLIFNQGSNASNYMLSFQ